MLKCKFAFKNGDTPFGICWEDADGTLMFTFKDFKIDVTDGICIRNAETHEDKWIDLTEEIMEVCKEWAGKKQNTKDYEQGKCDGLKYKTFGHYPCTPAPGIQNVTDYVRGWKAGEMMYDSK